MKWAVYVRISEDRTGEEWGVKRQLEDIHRVIAARDPEPAVVEFVENDVSAYKKKPRPKFEQMMRLVSGGEFDVICAKHMDRLLRRLIELEQTLEVCAASNTYILTTHDGVDTSTEGGRLVARILASVAQGEVERKRARQKSAAEQAAKRGKWTGGRRPFGYNADGTENPFEADLVRAAYARVLAGGAINAIAREWNASGVKTTLGYEWSAATVRQVLERPRNAGYRTYYGDIVGESDWDRIVSEETYSAVMAILTAPGRQFKQGRKHLLTGIIKCGVCGRGLGVTHNPHPVYKCKGCGKVNRHKVPVDALVVKLMKGFLASDQAKELLIDRSREDLAVLRVQESNILGKIDQLAVDFAQDLLTARQVKVATEKLEAELRAVRGKMRDSSREKALAGVIEGKETWEELSLDRQRAIIRESIDLTLLPAGKGVHFKPEHLRYRWLVDEE